MSEEKNKTVIQPLELSQKLIDFIEDRNRQIEKFNQYVLDTVMIKLTI